MVCSGTVKWHFQSSKFSERNVSQKLLFNITISSNGCKRNKHVKPLFLNENFGLLVGLRIKLIVW